MSDPVGSGDPGAAPEQDPLDGLVQDYLRAHRAGEPLSVEAYARAHPAHADALRDLLPTLLALESVKRDRETSTGGRARPSLPPLERLGDFRILRELGRGGMGVVFEAVQESLDRKVALKVLPQASLLTERQLERFRREAHIAAQLHHSHIVPVFGSGESDGYQWYAMQFIDGQSLDRWRAEQSQAPPVGSGAWRSRARFVARVGVEAAHALHHAHQHGTLHRDIKPGNLLLDRSEHVWVTDFGLAKALEDEGLTHSGDILGTLQYMAPEQFAGQYDARSEVYALGVTLYELLLLRPAFAARSRSELLERIRTQTPDSLRRTCPGLPEDLVLIVEHAMARDPADRYPDAAALARDLEAFLEDRPIAARRQTAVGLLLRWCRRNKAMAALAASTLLALVLAAVTGWTAYVTTDDALGKAKESATKAQQESDRAEANLRLALAAFNDVFDALVGRDRVLALDEDPDTGETVVFAPSVQASNVPLLEKMLRFYDAFAARNEGSQSLRLDTARAYRRVGAIQGRLGRLDAAAVAYEQALDRYRFVTERDVKREIAAVHVDSGQIEQRRDRRTQAQERYRQALQLLDSDAANDSRGLRFERAEVNFLLARTLAQPGGRGDRPGAGGGPPGSTPREEFAAARRHLAAAREELARLLAEDADEPEARALEARCLCFGAQLGGRPRGADDPREKALREGLEIFRDLVERHPNADHYRFELCNTLAGDLWRTLRGNPMRRVEADAQQRDVAQLEEAKRHAETLLRQQPDFVEYRALRGRIGTSLGTLLRLRSAQEEGEVRRATREAAEGELRAALAIEQQLLADAPQHASEPRFRLQSLVTRSSLGHLLADGARLPEAQAEAARLVADVQQAAKAMGPRPDPMVLIAVELVDRLARRVQRPDLVGEIEALRATLPSRERPPDRDRASEREPGRPTRIR